MTGLSQLGEIAKRQYADSRYDSSIDPMDAGTPVQAMYRSGAGVPRGRLAALAAGGSAAVAQGRLRAVQANDRRRGHAPE